MLSIKGGLGRLFYGMRKLLFIKIVSGLAAIMKG